MAAATASLLSPNKVYAWRMAWFAETSCHGTDSLGQSYAGPQEKEEGEEEGEGESSASIW